MDTLFSLESVEHDITGIAMCVVADMETQKAQLREYADRNPENRISAFNEVYDQIIERVGREYGLELLVYLAECFEFNVPLIKRIRDGRWDPSGGLNSGGKPTAKRNSSAVPLYDYVERAREGDTVLKEVRENRTGNVVNLVVQKYKDGVVVHSHSLDPKMPLRQACETAGIPFPTIPLLVSQKPQGGRCECTDRIVHDWLLIRDVYDTVEHEMINRIAVKYKGDGDDAVVVSTKSLGPISDYGLYREVGPMPGIHQVRVVGKNGDKEIRQVKDAKSNELVDYLIVTKHENGGEIIEALGLVTIEVAREAAGIEIVHPTAPNTGKKTNIGNPRGKGPSTGSSDKKTSNPKMAKKRARKEANKKK